MSNGELQAHIQHVALDTSRVIIIKGGHASGRMLERDILSDEVYEVLQKGCIERPPQPGLTANSRKCRMEHYLAGRRLAVVVAVDGDDPNLIVVTVICY